MNRIPANLLTINIMFSTCHLLSQTLHKFIKFPSQFSGILIITKRPITFLNKLFFILQPAGFPRSYRLLPFIGALFTVFDFTIISIASSVLIAICGARHSHVSLLIDMGFTPYLIAGRIGDPVDMVNNIYGYLYPHKHSEVASKLQDLVLN